MSPADLRPEAKGWCPGAYRPMMSGDGLVVRVRPVLGRVTREQALGIARLSLQFGSGVIDLTSRANLLIRGVREDDHEALLAALNQLELLPDDPALEARRNILLPHDWTEGDDSHLIATELLERLRDFPVVPAKFGLAIDAGGQPILGQSSADIRIERSAEGLILRADGAALGRFVTADTAVDAMIELAEWFAQNANAEARRMKTVLRQTQLPETFTQVAPLAARKRPRPGPCGADQMLGALFGQIDAQALSDLIEASGATALRTTPWRLFVLEDAAPVKTDDFITDPADPRLSIDACPGTQGCKSASVDTRSLARMLAGRTTKRLHISGCTKGCARARTSDLTLVGHDGAFDLVQDGHAWDAPALSGLSPDDLKTRIGEF